MMIVDSLVPSRKLAVDITSARYKQAPKIKLNRDDYRDLAHSMHLSGKINVTEIILKNHKTNPYRTVEEIVGDLQLVLMTSWNEFRTVNPSTVMGRLELEELVNELPECNQTLS